MMHLLLVGSVDHFLALHTAINVPEDRVRSSIMVIR
jgi:hypothetical protein